MKHVNIQEYESLVNSPMESFKVPDCPHCKHVAEIRIGVPSYNKVGVRVQCPYCECQTPYVDIASKVVDPETQRVHTTITIESLIEGIFEAIRIWSGGGKRAT